jgi:hypothetical protein
MRGEREGVRRGGRGEEGGEEGEEERREERREKKGGRRGRRGGKENRTGRGRIFFLFWRPVLITFTRLKISKTSLANLFGTKTPSEAPSAEKFRTKTSTSRGSRKFWSLLFCVDSKPTYVFCEEGDGGRWKEKEADVGRWREMEKEEMEGDGGRGRRGRRGRRREKREKREKEGEEGEEGEGERRRGRRMKETHLL